jgi:hypothetical protein
LKLRKTNPALRAGDAESITISLQTNAANNVLAYLRKNGNHEVLVLLNMSNQRVNCVVNDVHLKGNFIDIFSKSKHDFSENKSFDLNPWDYLVFEK